MANQPLPAFHVMSKPTGAKCNLDCDYCFFLKKENLYPGSNFRMSDEVLENYIKQTIEGQKVPHVTIAWQGGEPTLMGIDFFRRSIEIEKKYIKPGVTIENSLQTNGILIDEEWCQFLHENKFLIGLSIDGPKGMYDAYRRDKSGKSVFDKVIRALRLMQEYKVEFNILCTVNAANADYPLEVYKYFRDELGVKYIQLIPIVERDNESGYQEGTHVTDRTVKPEQYGRFLIEIFDEWIKKDVGDMFVLTFDGILASYIRGYSTLCIFQPTCGDGIALEHNGDVYSCDHYVEPDYLIGNIGETSLEDLVSSNKQRGFGKEKLDTLPRYCKECKFLFACNGECPKNRILTTPDGESGLNWLCEGLKAFFKHADKPMKIMADLLKQGRPAADVMVILAEEAKQRQKEYASTGRNDPCPCGSGKKFKNCHGVSTKA